MNISARSCALALGGALLLGCGDDGDELQKTAVTRSERVWVDATRATPRNGTFPGAPQRTLRVLIWTPPVSQATPLLVMAHGFGGLPEKFDAFARAVAASGLVVAAPAFPLTNANAPGGHEAGLDDLTHQPADVSFVLSQLLQAAETAGDSLNGRIVADAIAVFGHSLGGVTVIGLTRKSCCRDTRLRASILASTPLALAATFGSDPIAAGPPTLILHGTADATVDYSVAGQLYGLIQPPRFLVGLTGAGHSEPFEDQSEPAVPARAAAQRATIAFLNAAFRGGAADLDATLAQLAAQGNAVDEEP